MPGIRPAEAPTELTVVVRGHSMYPTLRDGEPVVVDLSAYREEPPAVGDVVLAPHPFMRDVWMIKRVVGLVAGGRCVLQGDNAMESSDSRSFGPIPLRNVRGRATRKADGSPLSLPTTREDAL
ncbi:S26 family signal peptidase [uncultured Fretibacterium sp.]|uniref:S26 family signal peptidase n=1 Tax=uncultured Fretibacterium sp. TaxID=1678694 RepID=UPI002620E227|nr:S26 family signal peptidase [uncultured Fretibacterium sp.]